MPKKTIDPRAIIIEFHQVGNAIKVSAMDPESLVEVSIVGALGTPHHDLERLVMKKLQRMIEKKRKKPKRDDGTNVLV